MAVAPSAESFRTVEAMKGIPNEIVTVAFTPENTALVKDLKRAALKMGGAYIVSEQNKERGEIRIALTTERNVRLRHLDYDDESIQEMFPSRRPT
ncbi:hypothetical protein ACFXPT_11825 [Streptomyces goshikiensis]|uniref:hypothetical protein n=1 Tax=Streptomyces goshikiensis TaxID=1942 RepID=UPI0036BBE7F0